MSQQTIELNDELVAVLTSLNRPVRESVPELVVLELYRRGVISSGKAAERFGLGREEFIRHASPLGIPFFEMTEAEWESERTTWIRKLGAGQILRGPSFVPPSAV